MMKEAERERVGSQRETWAGRDRGGEAEISKDSHCRERGMPAGWERCFRLYNGCTTGGCRERGKQAENEADRERGWAGRVGRDRQGHTGTEAGRQERGV